jgi:KDO2-lipid IV(A) lauroyltransferase
LEHVQAARAEGRGVILLSGHSTCMEIAGILLALLGLPVHTHYRRKRKNPPADRLALAGRSRYAVGQIDRDDVRRLVAAFRDVGMVPYSPDHQVRNGKSSVLVPFFGEPALMHSGLRDVARLSGACVAPYLPRRRDDHGCYEPRFLRLWTVFRGTTRSRTWRA